MSSGIHTKNTYCPGCGGRFRLMTSHRRLSEREILERYIRAVQDHVKSGWLPCPQPEIAMESLRKTECEINAGLRGGKTERR